VRPELQHNDIIITGDVDKWKIKNRKHCTMPKLDRRMDSGEVELPLRHYLVAALVR
jgi:hypothetical protein